MMRILGSLSLAQKVLATVIATVVFGVVAVTVYWVFPTATNQGYIPEQPIPFSHRLHAGQHQIDCRYCHVGVTKSRHATIPSLNVCMNCHSVVKTDSPHIQKIQKAYQEGKPIEWIRVHEMPDFVFFNHKPHIDKGVSCETCHGDVKSMDVVYQSETLHMGFCIRCHRGETTPMSVLRKIHPDEKDPRGKPVAPENCSTCHY